MLDVLHVSTYALQAILICVMLYFLSRSFFMQSTTYIWKHLFSLRKQPNPPKVLLFIVAINPNRINKPHQLLFSQLGWNFSYLYYLFFKRLLVSISVIALVTIIVISTQAIISNRFVLVSIITTIILILLFDQYWLRLIAKGRKKRIVYDVYQLSYHLLYFADSQMNIYNKLQRCLPYTSAIRYELQLLLLSWTHNSEAALQQFKTRLGCREAISFVDTIQALKQHQDEAFYSLLRERIEEYKDQLNLANDSKRETTSYILFILAGVPILYTFQVFIYPWVKEVQQLLLQMN